MEFILMVFDGINWRLWFVHELGKNWGNVKFYGVTLAIT